MGLLSLNNLEFYAHHGHFKEESIVGNTFSVDFHYYTDTSMAEKTDKLEDTVDYVKIYDCINAEMKKNSFLIEHVARRILERIVDEFPEIQYAEITLYKHHPPMKGKMDSVSISLNTDDLG